MILNDLSVSGVRDPRFTPSLEIGDGDHVRTSHFKRCSITALDGSVFDNCVFRRCTIHGDTMESFKSCIFELCAIHVTDVSDLGDNTFLNKG